jgi:hypothetical protein
MGAGSCSADRIANSPAPACGQPVCCCRPHPASCCHHSQLMGQWQTNILSARAAASSCLALSSMWVLQQTGGDCQLLVGCMYRQAAAGCSGPSSSSRAASHLAMTSFTASCSLPPSEVNSCCKCHDLCQAGARPCNGTLQRNSVPETLLVPARWLRGRTWPCCCGWEAKQPQR